MALLDFPSAPTVGQLSTQPNAVTYRFDGAVWTVPTVTGGGAGGGAAMAANVTPTGTRPGTSFTVPQLAGVDPTAILAVVNGLVLDQVAGAPAAVDECRLVGTTLTTGLTVTATDKFKVYLWY
jgi:hypothetical protein